MDKFIVIGTNHKYSPFYLREKLSLNTEKVENLLCTLKSFKNIHGIVVLSTCNRIEFYANVVEDMLAGCQIEKALSAVTKLEQKQFSPYFYRYQGKQALLHLALVANSLDSLVIGETQILGQVKAAFDKAKQKGATDIVVEDFFNEIIAFSRRVRRETKLNEGKVSIASLAIDFLKEKLGVLTGKKIMIIGTGKISELMLNYLEKEKPQVIFVANRTFAKAQLLAQEINARAVKLDNIKELIAAADIVISATASPHFIIRKTTLDKIKDRPLIIIDLALPRDVEPEVAMLENIELFGLEDLNLEVQKNIARRRKEAEKARLIIEERVEVKWKEYTESVLESVRLP